MEFYNTMFDNIMADILLFANGTKIKKFKSNASRTKSGGLIRTLHTILPSSDPELLRAMTQFTMLVQKQGRTSSLKRRNSTTGVDY